MASSPPIRLINPSALPSDLLPLFDAEQRTALKNLNEKLTSINPHLQLGYQEHVERTATYTSRQHTFVVLKVSPIDEVSILRSLTPVVTWGAVLWPSDTWQPMFYDRDLHGNLIIRFFKPRLIDPDQPGRYHFLMKTMDEFRWTIPL